MDVADKKGIDPETRKGTNRASRQLGMFFDQTRCDACYACAVACKDWHDVPAGPAKWLRISTIEKGTYPHLYMAFGFHLCTQCEDPPCVGACPAEAISKREEDGIVVVDRDKCVGKAKCGFPCSLECPAGNDVSGFASLISEGKHAKALELLIETNPFPGVCGRVCYHPCESACNRAQLDEPVAIRTLERFVGDHIYGIPPFTVERKGEKIAVVGAGPAGLSCAYHLAKRGYRVTVFEALPVAGGMLRVGIPEYRLPKSVLHREIAFIEAVGVEIKTRMRLGDNLSFQELDQFDAVFLAVGAHREKALDVPGIDLKEVIPGVEFLRHVNLNGNINIGKRVVVLGGGNVAFDCARTARRLGAAEVHLICPESPDDMLAEPSEIKQGEEEGIHIYTSRIPCKILGEEDCVSGVECLSLRSMAFDEEGKLHFEAVEGSEYLLPADTVILAIGQEPDLSFLPDDIRVDRGMISIDEDGATSRPQYFAGGDAAIPEKRVAWAIGSGRRAAEAIHRQLRGLSQETTTDELPSTECRLLDTDFIEKKSRVEDPLLPLGERLGDLSEVQLGLNQAQAMAEADRCLICQGMCLVACPYDAPQFGAEDNPRMQKCDFCLEEWEKGKQPMCVRSCTMRALDAGPMDELVAKYGEAREAEGFSYYEKSHPAIVFKPKFYSGE